MSFNNLAVDILLFIFLTISIQYSELTGRKLFRLKKDKDVARIKTGHSLLILSLVFAFIAAVFLTDKDSLLLRYFQSSFILLITLHGYFLARVIPGKRWAIALGAFALCVMELGFPTELSHNLFLFAAIAWLAPFLSDNGIVTERRFWGVSLIWFIYDIAYVWLSPLARVVISATQSVHFPLSVGVGTSFIGLADLLWVSMFLLFVPTRRLKFVSAVVFVASDVILGISSNTLPQFQFFPLLVLWIPLGIIMSILFSYENTTNQRRKN